MVFNLFIVAAALVLPTAGLILCVVRGHMVTGLMVALGALIGAVAGAGMLVGAYHQPTSADIHSQFSFASAFEWLTLAAAGGAAGAALGAALGTFVARDKLAV